ncbi:hypothetical protein D3C84_734070 [compost metagenome]
MAADGLRRDAVRQPGAQSAEPGNVLALSTLRPATPHDQFFHFGALCLGTFEHCLDNRRGQAGHWGVVERATISLANGRSGISNNHCVLHENLRPNAACNVRLRSKCLHDGLVGFGVMGQCLIGSGQFEQGFQPGMLPFAQQLLGQPQSMPGVGRDPSGQVLSGHQQVIRRDNARHQAIFERLLRRHRLAGK